MSEPTTLSSTRSTQTLKIIEMDPLNPAAWADLLTRVRGLNDPLSIKSLEIIIEGLNRIVELQVQAAKKGETAPRISPLSQSMFIRLAKAYNSPTLLKEVGLIYLRDLSSPHIALLHFERALRLGGPEKELRPLSEAAAVAVQRQLAHSSGQQAAHSGIATAPHAKPIATNIIRKTGKMLMPSRIGRTAVTRFLPSEAGYEPGSNAPLPATTDECLEAAEVAASKGHLARAELLLRRADAQPADNAIMWQAWTNFGQACYEAGQSMRIEEAFKEAIKYDPEEMASHFNLALGYHLNDKYEEAFEEYQKADEIEPENPKVWCNVGVLHFQQDELLEAENAFLAATTLNPDYARAWDNLAVTLGAQDKLDEALDACQKAIDLRPDYPEAFFKRGVIHLSRNEFAAASEELKKASELPDLAAYCEGFQSMIHSQKEEIEEAEAAVRRAAEIDPKCDLLWMAWNELGMALYAAGDFTRAADAYGEATMIKPDESEAWFNVGVSYHQDGDLKAARDAYQHAVDLQQSMAAAWHNLGIICNETNDHHAAMAAFRQEVHSDPDNIRAWYDFAVSLDKLGRSDDAAVAFAKVELLGQAQIEAPEY